VTQLPVPASQMQPNQNGITNVTSICTVADCSQTAPVTSLKQLEIPRALWEISSVLALRWVFHLRRSWVFA
jgi:hypothetical protein